MDMDMDMDMGTKTGAHTSLLTRRDAKPLPTVDDTLKTLTIEELALVVGGGGTWGEGETRGYDNWSKWQ